MATSLFVSTKDINLQQQVKNILFLFFVWLSNFQELLATVVTQTGVNGASVKGTTFSLELIHIWYASVYLQQQDVFIVLKEHVTQSNNVAL